jgi:ATP-dependent exoDNAse (exonuclease V) beta subunit
MNGMGLGEPVEAATERVHDSTKDATAALLSEDISARQSAIDVRGSYLVQAPAGSGKTELLTQRLLALLGQACDTPESVLAITFTNKAAAEMRQRVFESLWRAQTAPEPGQEPDKTNWQLARQVLRRSEQACWHLLENPGRLRIMTIDALCGSIAQQLPLLSEFGSQPRISDQPEVLYREAARAALAYWAKQQWPKQEWPKQEWPKQDQPTEQDPEGQKLSGPGINANPLVPGSSALGVFLRVDNDVSRLVDLLVQMLATRDQWLPHIVPPSGDQASSGSDQLLALLAQSLDHLIQSHLAQARQLFVSCYASSWPDIKASLLAAYQGFALLGVDLEQAQPGSLAAVLARLDREALVKIERASDLPMEDPDVWLAVVALLTTGTIGKGKYRKPRGITKAQGFPAASAGANSAEKAQLKENKERFQALLTDLSEAEDLLLVLNQISLLPPRRLAEHDERALGQLMDLLVLAVAFLKMSFQSAGEVDFCEVSLGAMRALGDTRLSDAAIEASSQYQHILVDEFQDTSVTQYHLLGHLVSDWQTDHVPEPEQPPTLFLVGDPMQSIYRFRQAEVGLFLQVKHYGIGPVKLQYLRLTRNFRSDPAVVNWVNQHFERIFPETESVTQGRVSYSASLAGRSPGHVAKGEPPLGVHLDWLASDEAIVTRCVRQIAQLRAAAPEASVAILVRGRRHLRQLLPALAQACVPFEAIEARSLIGEPIVQDLLALTTVVAQPEDALAWASVLRSPVCGLALEDMQHLFACAQGGSPWSVMKKVFESPATLPGLSAVGHRLIRRLVVPLSQVIEDFAYVPIIKKVRWAAWALGVLQQVSAEAQDCVAAFWQALERYLKSTQVFSTPEFVNQLSLSHGSVLASAPNPIQIMTIHKSKGLEFDHVFIPFAEKTGALDDNPLLQVQPIVFEQGEGLLMAALPDRATDTGPHLYHYLRYLNREKGLQELKRVLYVAVTRGKKRVTVLSKVSVDVEKEAMRSAREDAFLASVAASLSLTECEQLDAFVADVVAQHNGDSPQGVCAPTAAELSASAPVEEYGDEQFGALAAGLSGEKPWLLEGLPLNADVERLSPSALLPWEQVIAAAECETGFWTRELAQWSGPATLNDPLAGSCPEAWRRKRGNSTAATGALLSEMLTGPDESERLCGTYLHSWLEGYPNSEGIDRLAAQDWARDARAWFAQAGLPVDQIQVCCRRLKTCLKNLQETDNARWIMAPRPTTRVEWSLAIAASEGTKQLRIDRCFIEDDCFWIIDFKLSHLAHQSDSAILAYYGDQLRSYVKAVRAGWDDNGDNPLTVRFGIYFPENDRLLVE